MYITYRDTIGIITVELDYPNIQFLNNDCYFSVNGEEYRIDTVDLIEIGRF